MSPWGPPALHTPAPRMHLYPEPAAPCDPASHSPSMATTATAHTPPAPCTPAAWPTNAPAVPPLPLPPFLSSRLPHNSPRSCNTPPTASPQLHPPAPPPPLPPPPRIAPGSLRSLPTRSDIPGSSPARRSAPETQCPLPPTTAPGPPSGTSAPLPPPQTGPPQNAPPSTPAGSCTLAPLPLPLCTAPLPPPPAPVPPGNPRYISACSRSDGQSGQISYSMY